MLISVGFIIGTMFMYATPLLYTALGGAISENSGVVNIGLEGMMTFGAFAAATAGYYLQNPWLGLLFGGVAGGVLGMIHAIACVSFRADNVVSGIAINFLGPGLALFLARMFFEGTTHTKILDLDKKIPRPFNGLFEQNSFFDLIINQYATVFIAIALAFLVHFVFYYTRIGLRLRSVGEKPQAARTVGINVVLYRYSAVVVSGVLAGFGGASLSIAIVSHFWHPLISGQGFIALAAMIFGKWRPIPTMFACFMFGVSQGIVVFLGSVIPATYSEVLSMIPYVLTLVVLVMFIKRSSAPSALGAPLDE